ncbi:MAG: arylsulfatase [bacterium]
MKHSRRHFIKTMGLAGAAMLPLSTIRFTDLPGAKKTNIIFILGDDLGCRELGCYGQTKIKTPNIDRFAQEGIRFTQHYSGSPVCAPSRCVLLTGKHTGHSHVRDNREIQPEGQEPIPAKTVTIAKLLKQQGYTTAVIGKWGLGYPGSVGDPNKQGFDHFFGYNCQRHAHNYYPTYLWRNQERIQLEGNEAKETGKQYAPDLMEKEALEFIRGNKEHPFFLFYTTTIPHLALQVPEDSLAEYKDKWEETAYDGKKGYLPQKYPRAAYAAMVSRLDRSVGRILKLLKELNLEEDTLVLFSSDNGSTYDIGGYDPAFFNGTGDFRAAKGSVYDGGIRIPMIARCPGKIQAGITTDHLCAFQDILPTLLDVIGAESLIPRDIDGISYAPTLLNKGTQRKHPYLYMEFAAYGGQQMVRLGSWKGVRQNLQKNTDAPIELYNLSADIGEKNNVAHQHPVIVSRIQAIMKKEHTPSKEFPFAALDR